MGTFERNEIISATQFVRKFSTFLKELSEQSLKKIAIVRNNEMEAVVLSIDEYEQLLLSADFARAASKKTVKDFFGTMDNETFEQMCSAVADCRKVNLNEW